MIIGLSGKKGSGKDEVGAYLVKQYGFERRAFANVLKVSFAALLDIPVATLERYKNDPLIQLEIAEYASDEDLTLGNTNFALVTGMSIREALQRYGTEAHRDVFGDDFWVDQTLPVGGYYAGRAIVVTDCRFKNEAERIRHLGGYNVVLRRECLDGVIDKHRSEEDLPEDLINYFLQNNGTILDLHQAASEMLASLIRRSDTQL